MHKADKERLVEELAKRLAATDSLIVADYRGLTNSQLAGVRARLREHGATFAVVKNTLTRRAADAAGAESLLALLEGPTAIAFVEADGDPIAVAKALADTAKDTKILSLRGGILAGKTMEAADVEVLAKLPPEDVLKGQLVGVIVAPVTQLLGLLAAPIRDLVGLIDARVAQLGGDGGPADSAVAESASEASSAAEGGEPEPDASTSADLEAGGVADSEAADAAEPEPEASASADAEAGGVADSETADAAEPVPQGEEPAEESSADSATDDGDDNA